jgi:hypothetical protein
MSLTRYRRSLSHRVRRCHRVPRRRLPAGRSTRVRALFLPGRCPPPFRRPFLRPDIMCTAYFSSAATQNRAIVFETHGATPRSLTPRVIHPATSALVCLAITTVRPIRRPRQREIWDAAGSLSRISGSARPCQERQSLRAPGPGTASPPQLSLLIHRRDVRTSRCQQWQG